MQHKILQKRKEKVQHTCVEKEEMAWKGGSNSSRLDAYVADCPSLAKPYQIYYCVLKYRVSFYILTYGVQLIA